MSVDDATYGALVEATRDFLDRLAGAVPDAEAARELTTALGAWTRILEWHAGDEESRVFGRRTDLPSYGQAMTPAYRVQARDDETMSGVTRFGGFFLGGNAAAHGGAVPLLFDELFGWVVNGPGKAPARTAYLHVDYRAVVRLDRDLTFCIRRAGREGRKQYVRGELRDGDVLCAEAEALFVELRPGQP